MSNEDSELAARVRAERVAQGLPAELTDEQMDFIGAVVFSDLRRLKAEQPNPPGTAGRQGVPPPRRADKEGNSK